MRLTISTALFQDTYGIESIRSCMLLGLLMGSIYYDLRFRIIPNWLTAPGLVMGLLMLTLDGVSGFLQAVWLVCLLTYPFVFGFQRGWVGGGDVKLVAAVGLLSGLDLAIPIFLAGTIMAGVFSLYCLAGASPRGRWDGRNTIAEKVWIPYGACYALGALVLKGILAWGLIPLAGLHK
ncbi:MAG: hypothetical protein GX986_03455 [Firmicutes bacterium]|nr:hypothetical protein [Bacillota bacterium]